MTTIRRFCCDDLLRFAPVNLDHLTETFNMSFYMTYMARWPDYFHTAVNPGDRVMGYIMGKVEGQGESWHGHVTAVSVAPEFRRQKLAKTLMNLLEEISDKMDKAYFVDLFVRASNMLAIRMYEKATCCSLKNLEFSLAVYSGSSLTAASMVVDNVKRCNDMNEGKKDGVLLGAFFAADMVGLLVVVYRKRQADIRGRGTT